MVAAINTHRRACKKKKKATRNSCLAYTANAPSLSETQTQSFMARLPSLGACLRGSSLWMHSPFHCLSHQFPSYISDFNQKHIFFPLASYGGKYNQLPCRLSGSWRVLRVPIDLRQCQFAQETWMLSLRGRYVMQKEMPKLLLSLLNKSQPFLYTKASYR